MLWFPGIPGLRSQVLSYVTVEFLGMTPKGQISHHDNVLEDGSFTASSDCILKVAGKCEISKFTKAGDHQFINEGIDHVWIILSVPILFVFFIDITVSTPLSTLSSTLHLSILPPSPQSLKISLLHGPQGAPSCNRSIHSDSSGVTNGVAAYQGDPVTLQAFVSEGSPAEFCWCFTHGEKETASLSQPRRLNSPAVSQAGSCLSLFNLPRWQVFISFFY